MLKKRQKHQINERISLRNILRLENTSGLAFTTSSTKEKNRKIVFLGGKYLFIPIYPSIIRDFRVIRGLSIFCFYHGWYE